MSSKVSLQVHHVRFFDYQPQTINCIAYDETSHRIAISRSDASIEIFSTSDNWCLETTFAGSTDASVEALVWSSGRLFAAGLGGNVVELDLHTRLTKESVSSNAGPIWCLTKNASGDQLAAGTEDGCVVLFDISDNLQFIRGFGKQADRIISIAWYNSNGENIIITGGINNIRQWSVKSGQPISRMTLGRKFLKEDSIVWCIAVTKTFTIISGDSRGIVTFWNGKESTQMKTFQCHRADVLCLCLNKDETKVYSGGVDATVSQFSLCAADPQSERKRWVHQILHKQHTHDVRAVACTEGCVASAGVDSILQVAHLEINKAVLWVTPFPPVGLVHTSSVKNLIQLQYPTYIEVWRLGAADSPTEDTRGILPLTQQHRKLLQLKAREGQQIVCSAMSNDSVVAFSDSKGVRIYRLDLEKEDSSSPSVRVTRVKCRFPSPAHLLQFSPDGQHLIALLSPGRVQVMKVDTGELQHTLKPVSDSPVHLLAVSPDSQHIATATVDHNINIYSMETGQLVCSCPVQTSQVSAISFSPHQKVLAIAYCNHAVFEFDYQNCEYTAWSRENSGLFPPCWLKPSRRINRLIFNPSEANHIIFYSDNNLCVLDKTVPLIDQTDSKSNKGKKMTSIRRCFKYKFLMWADFLDNGMLVVVERPPSSIEESLPPSFKRKKFGIS